MPHPSRIALLAALVSLAAFLVACAPAADAPTDPRLDPPPQEEPADPAPPAPTDPADPPAVEPPTEGPPPADVEPLDPVLERWRLPFLASLLIVSSYESLMETADRNAAGDLDEEGTFEGILGVGMALQAALQGLQAWFPEEDQEGYATALEDQISAISVVAGDWIEEEIEAGDVAPALEQDYSDATATLEGIVMEMQDDGIADDDIVALATEMADAMQEIDMEMTEAAPPG